MAPVTRRIGLSLGADICWPIAFEEILSRLSLEIPVGSDTVSVECERVMIEPFDLRSSPRYDVVIDRLTHWYHLSREWIKKSVVMDGVYVFNNPWSIQSMEKQTSYCALMRLGIPVPDTWLVPPKEYEDSPDLQPTLERYARLFDLKDVGGRLGYPMFMKPYDGGGWVGVSRIDDAEALEAAYEKSGRHVMHLQKAVDPHDLFVRCVGLGPQIRKVLYDPGAPLHDRYTQEVDFLEDDDRQLLEEITLTINAFFGWDFNSCECLRNPDTKVWHPIDFANPCPDSQVTSLHYHFPWLIKANLRWALFNACLKRRRPMNLNWNPFFEVADSERSLREKISAYAELAHAHFETDRFVEFCETHLSHLDEVADEWFSTAHAKEAVRKKVVALFPEDEVEEFTDLFFDRIQKFREQEAGRDANGGYAVQRQEAKS